MNQRFELIHGRYLMGSISNSEWVEVYREAYEYAGFYHPSGSNLASWVSCLCHDEVDGGICR